MGPTPWKRRLLLIVLAALAFPGLLQAGSDEFSSGDKLRTLYSNHFGFTDSGVPQVTIEVMGGQSKVEIFSRDGLTALPDGEGGATLTGSDEWTITLEGGSPAKVREWSIVERLSAEDALDAEVAIARWKKRGHEATSFEIGTIFAVAGEVLDTREVLIAVDPTSKGKGEAQARALSSRYDVEATVYTELVRRPTGTVIARSGNVELRNPSVLWFQNGRRDHRGTITVRDVEVGGGGSQLKTRRHDRSYFGLVYVTVGSDGKLSVVNAVAADDLLSGLVPSEMFPDAPMEALKAQSIAARTELLRMLGMRHLGDPFLLCASQHCQVYSGAGHEHPRTTKAVKSTRGQVLVNDKALVDARYSAACGGHTEHNEVVWGGEPSSSLRGLPDAKSRSRVGISEQELVSFLGENTEAYCAKTKYSKGRFRWTVSADVDTLSQELAKSYPKLGRLKNIEAKKRGVSGRIYELRLIGTKSSATVNGELTIRRLLGGLRSSLFTVEVVGPDTHPEKMVFRGGGFGHGVGMCQLGAIGMASSGQRVNDILARYYSGVSIHRLY